jgi:hypothetical protein
MVLKLKCEVVQTTHEMHAHRQYGEFGSLLFSFKELKYAKK